MNKTDQNPRCVESGLAADERRAKLEQIAEELARLVESLDNRPDVNQWGYPSRKDWSKVNHLARQWLKLKEASQEEGR